MSTRGQEIVVSSILTEQSWNLLPEATRSTNPFLTLAYARARQSLGDQAVLVGGPNTNKNALTVAFLRRGRLNRSLEIPSLPVAAEHQEFWTSVLQQCSEMGITHLEVNTFGSEPFRLPDLRGEKSRIERREFCLNLEGGDLAALLSNSHRKNVKKALARGCVLSKSGDVQALVRHRELMTNSIARRNARGESVPLSVQSDEQRACLASGSGLLYQITYEGSVVSSVLVLRAEKGAYTHSSGNHPDGMKIGASALLPHLLSLELQRDGFKTLRLGGAPPQSGLAEFKAGFGAEEIPLAAAECQIGAAWRRHLATLAHALVRRSSYKAGPIDAS